MDIPTVIVDIIVDYRMGLNTVIKRNELVKDMAIYYFNVYPMHKYFQLWNVEYIYAWSNDNYPNDNIYERPTPIRDYENFCDFLHSAKRDYWLWKQQVARRKAMVLRYPQFYDDDGYNKQIP